VTFEVFHRPRAARGPMLVTVQENGVLRLNMAAYRALDQPTYVHLLYDGPPLVTTASGPWCERIAIRACAGSSDTTFRAGGSGMIGAAEFIRYIGLAPGKYPAAFVDDLLVVDCG